MSINILRKMQFVKKMLYVFFTREMNHKKTEILYYINFLIHCM